MRHGIAEDSSATGRDADRALTREGTLRTAMVARGMARVCGSFDRIVASTYTRAIQTAEIVARASTYQGTLETDARLVPFARFEDAAALIAENSDVEHLLLVGHEPSMSAFIGGLAAHGGLAIQVKKASITAIELSRLRPSPAGTLLWSVTPAVVEQLGR